MEKQRIYKRLFVIVAAMFVLFSLFFTAGIGANVAVFADGAGYSSVMDDLQKDENFNSDEYLENASDYSVQVIQIAESTDRELFIYTYQPSQKTTYLTATEINMSLSDKVDGTRLYTLTLLNCDGVFCKYKVNDFTVSKSIVRYYYITSIYREWLNGIDEESGNNSTKEEVAFPAGMLWTVCTMGGNVYYGCTEKETIEVVDKYPGYLRYASGYHFLQFSKCDSHYVAFTTDKPIERLIEASVFYVSQSVTHYYNFGLTSDDRGSAVSQVVSLSDIDTVTVGGGLFAKTYGWNRIQSVSEFIGTESLSDNVKNDLQGKEWVLRFAETDYTKTGDYKTYQEKYTEVSEVSILRLEFETDEKHYNLGVVDGKQTGSSNPGNNNQNEVDLGNNPISNPLSGFKYVWNCIVKLFTGKATFVEGLVAVVVLFVAVFALPIVLSVLSIVFPTFRAVMAKIFKAIGKALLWLLKGIWWLICLPFRGIAALIRKCRSGKRRGGSKRSRRRAKA